MGGPRALFVRGSVLYIYIAQLVVYTIYLYIIYMAHIHIWPYGSFSMALPRVYIYLYTYIYIHIHRSSRVSRPLALLVLGPFIYIYSSTGGIYNIFIYNIHCSYIYMALWLFRYGTSSRAYMCIYIYIYK